MSCCIASFKVGGGRVAPALAGLTVPTRHYFTGEELAQRQFQDSSQAMVTEFGSHNLSHLAGGQGLHVSASAASTPCCAGSSSSSLLRSQSQQTCLQPQHAEEDVTRESRNHGVVEEKLGVSGSTAAPVAD
eukprot:3735726-Amphidinium_carterae.1